MTEPVHIRVERPYQSTEEFLEAEAWSVAARSMLLIGVDSMPAGTALRCELLLRNGQVLIVAEGTALKYAEATPTRPAGLVVRYKRMSAASSDFVKRAVARAAEGRTASSPTAAEGPFSSRASNPAPSPSSRASNPAPRPSSRASNPAPRPSSRAPARRSERPPGSKRPLQPGHTSGRPEAPGRRSSRPAGRTLSQPSLKAPSERRLSVAPSKGPGQATAVAASRNVSATTTHDSNAMQRLRTRHLSRAISSPPDREAVLARLKKKSER